MRRYGFTLLELLVVVAIIGTLSAILLPNFTAMRQRGRDTTRKSDLKTIQKALELYRQNMIPPAYPAPGGGNTFPGPNTCWSTTGFSATCPAGGTIYLRQVPTDPILNPTTSYYYSISGLTYTLAACLENTADPDGEPCPGGFACASGRCYIVSEL